MKDILLHLDLLGQNLWKYLLEFLPCPIPDCRILSNERIYTRYYDLLLRCRPFTNEDPAAKWKVIQDYRFLLLPCTGWHSLHQLQIPSPRILSESAHAETGIKCHPVPKSGSYFCHEPRDRHCYWVKPLLLLCQVKFTGRCFGCYRRGKPGSQYQTPSHHRETTRGNLHGATIFGVIRWVGSHSVIEG